MQLNKPAETIKFILENLRTPDGLDNHPWAMSAFTKEYLQNHPESSKLSPGQQLAMALTELFQEWTPASPPRQGKRLDNRWGEYGLLAAQYIAPYLFGTASPRSLKEAWGSIDQSIALMVKRKLDLPDEQIAAGYQLVVNEPEAANSTISDWHRKGIERFAAFVTQHEEHIHAQAARLANLADNKQAGQGKQFGLAAKIVLAILLLSLVVLAGWAYLKTQRMLTLARLLRQEMQAVQQLDFSIETLEQTETIEESLKNFDTHLHELDAETRPFLWITPSLGWLPVYGGDVENSEALLDMALALNDSVQQTYSGVFPFAELLAENEQARVDDFIAQIKASQPAFEAAAQSLQIAKEKRSAIKTHRLSPEVRELLVEKIDPALARLEQGLAVAGALPGLIGAGTDGLKTYMVILQNEDELRATGGFLTAAGSVVLRDGKIVNMVFESSDQVDDISKPYPPPPWQLYEYMNASIYLLRDANWSPDFPTTVAWVEYLYAYTRAHSVDGVIALDQHALVEILKAIGPVQVEGYEEPITAKNIIQVMRESKIRPEDEDDPDWHRKDFIGSLAEPMLRKIMAGDGFSWQTMLKATTVLLDEKHILLQLDEPRISNVLVEQGWNGRVAPFDGDYLMMVDSNIGFSKTNAIIEQKIELEIDLRNPDSPRKHISSEYNNPVESELGCGDKRVKTEDSHYPIVRCYGNYLRIYAPKGSLLTAASPHAVPAEWTLLGQFVPARVDTLTDDLDDFSVFGTYFIVPSGQILTTSFSLDTPASVLVAQKDGTYRYTLKLQKQPGTIGIPISFRLVLPDGANIIRSTEVLASNSNVLTGQFRLRKDMVIEVVFLP
jgi:hypothetical protein